MNAGIRMWIECLRRLGEKVEIVNNEIVIHNHLVPHYVVETLVEKIERADTKHKYKVTVKSA